MKIGARLPTHGVLPTRIGIGSMAARLEEAGFDSLWASDHMVAPATVRSFYPYSADGTVSWPHGTPFFDCIVALTAASSATKAIELGTAALVLPLRPPVGLAKQLATLDVISGGRLSLGVGAGWMREEFDALGVAFERRGLIEEESIGIIRQCWTGYLTGTQPMATEGVECYPLPAHAIPILVGGMSAVALRRVGRVADGWLAQMPPDRIDVDQIASLLSAIHASAQAHSRVLPVPFRVVLRIGPDSHVPGPIASSIPDLAAAGVTDVIVDADWESVDGPKRVAEELRAASGRGNLPEFAKDLSKRSERSVPVSY